MTRKEAFDDINRIQDEYIEELVKLINNPEYEKMKAISFTSATGTGKTKMMSKLINKFPDYFFIVTTLSKGQLHTQVRNALVKDCQRGNFIVYGSADYKINSVLEADDIIGKIPSEAKCIWLRDEGHIKTNRFDELLIDACYKVINFSATNIYSDIKCNFTQTMMLRTVTQMNGKPEDAIKKLLEIKKIHSAVKNYNPCAIFRCVGDSDDLYNEIVSLCKKYKMKYIDISTEAYDMTELCQDDNAYDVIINKYKLVEGIDIRRAHILYMDNKPANTTTTIQAIGRCRRNALLYRTDIDILDPRNTKLLEQTRRCYVYYNIDKMKIDTDEFGELQYAFCNHISCESLKAGMSVQVINGQLFNGLYVIELEGITGTYNIIKDEKTGCNIVDPITPFYDAKVEYHDQNYIYTNDRKIHIDNIKHLPLHYEKLDYKLNQYVPTQPYYVLGDESKYNVEYKISSNLIALFENRKKQWPSQDIIEIIQQNSMDYLIMQEQPYNLEKMESVIRSYMAKSSEEKGLFKLCQFLNGINDLKVNIDGFTYCLSEVCNSNEIIIIMYFCIEKKNYFFTDEDIYKWIIKVLEQRRELYARYYFVSEIKKSVYFDAHGIEEFSTWDDLERYINIFLEENKEQEDYKNLCEILTDMRNTQVEDRLSTLKKSCSYNDITFIQYCCINEKKEGVADDAILKRINEYVNAKYKFNLKRDDIKLERIIFILFEQNINISYGEIFQPLSTVVEYPNELKFDEGDIDRFFNLIDNTICGIASDNEISNIAYKFGKERKLFVSCSKILGEVEQLLTRTESQIKANRIPHVVYSYSSLYEQQNEIEKYLIRNRYLETYHVINADELENCRQIPYMHIINDKEISIIGVDMMKQIRTTNDDFNWSECTTVTSKVGNYNKLNSYITKKYAYELEQAKLQYVSGHNEFNFDKKCNSMIGYCVEYYSKYLVYGEEYLKVHISQAKREMGLSGIEDITNAIIVRACILKYRERMILCYGTGVAKASQSISAKSLCTEKYQEFIDLIVMLGERTANYVKKNLYPDVEEPKDNINTDLSVRHITGLADYITKDTILDVKVRNNIDEKSVRQVLAYHYLSTKRTDLHINRVIVYDATSDKAVVINIAEKNIVTHEDSTIWNTDETVLYDD